MKNKYFILSVLQLTLDLLKFTISFNHILAGRHPTYSYQKRFETELLCSCKLWTVLILLIFFTRNFLDFFCISLIIAVLVPKLIMILPSEGHMAVSELNKQHIFYFNINISSPPR